MTPETLYANHASSLNMDNPVLLSATPSRNVSIQVSWGIFIISGVKAPWALPFTSSSKRYYIHNVVVTIDTVIHNLMLYTYWNTCFEPRASTKREYCDFCWNPGPQEPQRNPPSLTRYPSWPRDPSAYDKIVCPLQKQLSEWEHEKHSTCSWKHCVSSCASLRPALNGIGIIFV